MRLLSLVQKESFQCKLCIVGCGAGGVSAAAKFARKLGPRHVVVIDPSEKHWYQPGLTLAAAGLMPFGQLSRDQLSLVPRGVDWFRASVARFAPTDNTLLLDDGRSISYQFLVIATGLELRYDMIRGLSSDGRELLDAPGLCSDYFPAGAKKTLEEIVKFPRSKSDEAMAIFTFPNTPIKCPGAPLKICLLFEEHLRRTGKRERTNVEYCTAGKGIFGVPRYAASLSKIAEARNVKLRLRSNLIAMEPNKSIATFQKLNEDAQPTGEQFDLPYTFLHIGPPCSPVKPLREYAQNQGKSEGLTDEKGWVRVDPQTLQSLAHWNVFALGDCANTPNSKTSAAIAAQLKTVETNLGALLAKSEDTKEVVLTSRYNGYASCPLVVDRRHVILAEFDGQQKPLETFPFDQSQPSYLAYLLKRYILPPLYWSLMVKGRYNGPESVRKLAHFIFAPFRRKQKEEKAASA